MGRAFANHHSRIVNWRLAWATGDPGFVLTHLLAAAKATDLGSDPTLVGHVLPLGPHGAATGSCPTVTQPDTCPWKLK